VIYGLTNGGNSGDLKGHSPIASASLFKWDISYVVQQLTIKISTDVAHCAVSL